MPATWQTERRLLPGILGALLILSGLGALSFRTINDLVSTADWVEHTQKVLGQIETLVALKNSMREGMQSYLLTGNQSDLELFNTSRVLVLEQIKTLRGITADNPREQRNLDEFSRLIDRRIKYSDQLVSARAHNGFAAARKIYLSPEDSALEEAIASSFSAMRKEEETLLAERRQRESQDTKRALSVMTTGVALALVMVGVAAYMLHRDLRLRQRAEELLRQSRAQLQAILDNAEARIYTKDAQGRYLLFNKRFTQLLGTSEAAVAGKTAYELFSNDKTAADAIHLHDQRVLDEGRPIQVEEQIPQEDGLHTYLSLKFPIYGADGRPHQIGGISTDITQRKKMERSLREAKEKAEAAYKELESFSYSVSHDLRAPLRSIDGFSQALLEDCASKLDAQGKDYLNRVRTATQRMAQLIDDLLALSRVSRHEMKRESVDLSSIAASIAQALKEREPERLAEFSISAGLKTVGDSGLLRSALENLLGNSWKYTSKLPRSAVIEFSSLRQEDGTPAFFVRDNGAGFDMAYSDKLFGAFQRLHKQEEYPGTGIGLATVARVIQRHGGKIWAEAAVGRGAAFYFTLTAAEPAGDKETNNERTSQS